MLSGWAVYYNAYQFDLISYNCNCLMQTDQPATRRCAFPMEGQLAKLAQQLRLEITALKGLLQGQSKQIEGLNFQWKMQAQDLKALQRQNHQIEAENKRLRQKIQQLVSSFSLLGKQKTEDHSPHPDPHPKQPLPNPFPSFHSLQSLSKLSPSSSSNSLHPSKHDSGKFLIQTRPTRENDEPHEEDSDEDIIECVWDRAGGFSGKTDFLQQARYNPLNPHLKQFTVERKEKVVKIVKIRGEGFLSPSHNFVHGQSLSKLVVSRFRVRRIRIKDIFLMGVGSELTLRLLNSFKNPQLVAFSSNGDLWKDGDSHRVGKQTREDQTIQMMVDLVKGEIIWEVDGVVATKVAIPTRLANTDLYFVLVMFNKGDELELQHPV